MAKPKFPVKCGDRAEFIGQIMDVFENFLDEKGIEIPSSIEQMKDDDNYEDNAAILYGDDYSEIADFIEDILLNWKVLEPQR